MQKLRWHFAVRDALANNVLCLAQTCLIRSSGPLNLLYLCWLKKRRKRAILNLSSDGAGLLQGQLSSQSQRFTNIPTIDSFDSSNTSPYPQTLYMIPLDRYLRHPSSFNETPLPIPNNIAYCECMLHQRTGWDFKVNFCNSNHLPTWCIVYDDPNKFYPSCIIPSSVAVPAGMNRLPSTSSLQGATFPMILQYEYPIDRSWRFSRNISQHKKARISIISLPSL